jgi:hypothetical protein
VGGDFRPPSFFEQDETGENSGNSGMGSRGDAMEDHEGIEELDRFAINTLQALIKREKSLGMANPTIEHLARVDIACLWEESSGWRYFVNEITRLPTVGLWGKHLDEPVWDKLRVALVSGWLKSAGR